MDQCCSEDRDNDGSCGSCEFHVVAPHVSGSDEAMLSIFVDICLAVLVVFDVCQLIYEGIAHGYLTTTRSVQKS